MQRQLSYKKSLLVICKISRLFPKTMSADGKYSLLDRDNLTGRIQMLLSPKQKTFCEFSSSFLKSSVNLEHFPRKDDPHKSLSAEIKYSLLDRDKLTRRIQMQLSPKQKSFSHFFFFFFFFFHF